MLFVSFLLLFVVFQSTVTINHIMEELHGLMKTLPAYSNDFLDIIVHILQQYYESCNSAFKSKLCLMRTKIDGCLKVGRGRGRGTVSSYFMTFDIEGN